MKTRHTGLITSISRSPIQLKEIACETTPNQRPRKQTRRATNRCQRNMGTDILYRVTSARSTKMGLPRGLSVWTVQFITLVKKNLVILKHKWFISALMAVLPSVFIILLYILNNALPSSTTVDVSLELKKCMTFNVYGQVRRRLLYAVSALWRFSCTEANSWRRRAG